MNDHAALPYCFIIPLYLFWGQPYQLSIIFAPVSELAEPQESLRTIHLLCNHLCHHVSSVHVNSANSHDPLSVSLGEVSQEEMDEGVQLVHLLLVVVLQSCLVTFFQSGEGYVHLRGPPDLSASQCNLSISN